MRLQFSASLALLSAPLFAFAQQEANPFSIPSSGLSATGGQPLKLSWNPTTQGTVSLVLRSGSSDNLKEGTVIASGVSNSGSYTWTPSNSLTRGDDYTIEIVDDSDPNNQNYTPYFVLDTPTTEAKSTSEVTLGAPSSTIQKETASPTGKASGFLSTASSSQSSASSSGTSAAAGSTTSGSSSTSSSTSSTTAGAPGASGASAIATQSSGSATATEAGASTASQGSGARATAMVGMLGFVALGALAL